MSSQPLAAEARDVTKRVWDGRERRAVVQGVSMTLAAGELTVLRGPSGSGKTTLLALLGAMLTPTSGEILLDGEPTSRLREVHRAEVRRRKVGFVFQDHQLLPNMSARDNLLVPCVPDGLCAADEHRADALLERFGVASIGHARAETLAGGERQRVAIARALMKDARLLLLDEPTAHLDDARAGSLVGMLDELAREGRAVLVATHDPRMVGARGVSRVLDLAGGRLLAHDPGDPAHLPEGDPSP